MVRDERAGRGAAGCGIEHRRLDLGETALAEDPAHRVVDAAHRYLVALDELSAEVGQIKENIEVTGSSPILQTESATVGEVMSAAETEETGD